MQFEETGIHFPAKHKHLQKVRFWIHDGKRENLFSPPDPLPSDQKVQKERIEIRKRWLLRCQLASFIATQRRPFSSNRDTSNVSQKKFQPTICQEDLVDSSFNKVIAFYVAGIYF